MACRELNMKHITLHIVKNTIIQDYLKYIPENFEVVQHDDVLTLLKNINRLNIPLIAKKLKI